MNGLGTVSMWGMAPALDAQEVWRAEQDAPRATGTLDSEPLNVLVSKCGDIRHVLKTIAQRDRWPRKPIHFYVCEDSSEELARHLLLLAIATDWAVPLRVRAHLWLEVFGNALVQERTSFYIARKAKELVALVCEDKAAPLRGVVETTSLKFRHRDELEQVFKSWHHTVPFDTQQLRDQRLRHHYGERYDFRKNLIDWDYQMSIRPVASIIHRVHYRTWRQTGVAFEFGDQSYTTPNRSLATYAEGRERGVSRLRRGFWQDIVNSPYPALGTACDAPNKFAEQLFDIYGKGTGSEQHRHNAVEVSVYNLLSFLSETETGRPYRMRTAHDVYSGLGDGDGTERRPAPDGDGASGPDGVQGADDGDDEAADASGATPVADVAAKESAGDVDALREKEAARRAADAQRRAKHIRRAFSGVQIFPIGGGLKSCFGRQKYLSRFDRVLLGPLGAQALDDAGFHRMLKPGAVVTMETAKHVVPFKAEQKAEFARRVRAMADRFKMRPATGTDGADTGSGQHFVAAADVQGAATRGEARPAVATAQQPGTDTAEEEKK